MNISCRVATVCFLLFGFIESFSQQFTKIKINLDQAYGGAFSDYLDNIEYIPLETTKSSLFGNVSQLIITDSSFVITDIDTKSILFFSTSGKFLRRISKSGGLSPAVAIHDVHKNEIEIAFENSLHTEVAFEIYSLTGNFIKKANIVKSQIDFIRNSIIIDKNNYWLKNREFNIGLDSGFYFSHYKDGVKVKSLIPFDSLNRYGFYRLANEISSPKKPAIYSSNFYFSTPFEHKIYKVSALKDLCEPLYQIIFPASYGINYLLLAKKEKKEMDSIINTSWFSNKTVLYLEDIFCDSDKLLFRTRTGASSVYGTDGRVMARNFLYKFQQGKLIAFERIRPDSSTYFLPFRNSNTIAYEGFNFNKEFMYTYISSLEMFTTYQATKQKKPSYPPVLQYYFKNQNRKSNPIIVRMKLKE